jgi:cold-inducible RNA-binding protein
MKIYVGNLSKQVTDKDLNDLAVPFGTLQSANVATERSTGQSKGFGFLEFANDDEARAAISGLNGKDVRGQTRTGNEARPKKDAPAARA